MTRRPAVLIGSFIILVAACATYFSYYSFSPQPRSRSEFIEAYRAAYKAGDKSTILALAKWDGVPSEYREFLENLLTAGIGTYQISTIELTDFDRDPNFAEKFGGRKLEPNLTPKYWLKMKAKGEGWTEPEIKIECAVGIENGVFRFCGVRKAGQ